EWTAAAQAEPRRAERKGLDGLRDEALQRVIANVAYAAPAPSRPLSRRSMPMKLSRIALLVVALGAGGLAAFMATQRAAPVAIETITQMVEEPKTRILVAKAEIGVGERLSGK